jgi:hypothetical protein
VEEDFFDLLRVDLLLYFFFLFFLSFLDRTFLRCFFAVFLAGLEDVDDDVDEDEEAGLASEGVGVGVPVICEIAIAGVVGVMVNGK